ncbi:hypothetical protein N7492_004424 [Penicillium capsulatum]|uniref:Nuclear pore complex protein An-Nup82 n=1 Tax=Penicillium capsulatum TaxID=69766 RepID=A0A9W9I7V1_9EURO|nr:hypothetical protein N7492_004424 [Penicillium capsulatum]KAJ6136456.1 hypothetical protein N7512_001616 [Penicillium capsulatum]
MPKVTSYAPAWLSRPSPGASVFSRTTARNPAEDLRNGTKPAATPATRTIAKRGIEIFTAVDNEIRWSDLARLKDQWQQRPRQQKDSAANQAEENSTNDAYKVLTVPVYGLIKQILPSPNGAFLAIVTEHTVHISVLPHASHLASPDPSPIRLKTYQLGPTTHVIPESPVVSALWHPLGLHTNLTGCIVTITADAAVRVWEVDRNNHWSFDQPTLAVDLRKLVDGTSSGQDFTPAAFGKSKGFSVDNIDMEVASACFAGNASDKEDAWSPMTLWVAMKPGDLYALCPLLPSKWQAPATTIPSLTSAIIPKLTELEDASADLEEELIAARQQYEWLQEIDDQEALEAPASDTIRGADVFARPVNPSAIPRLQGPFRFNEEYDDLDLCDMLVLAAGLNVEDLMMGEDEQLAALEDDDRLSATIICLTSGNGRVHICVKVEGVEGQWLPKTSRNVFPAPTSGPAELVLLEALDTMKQGAVESAVWPTFTKDVECRYCFFVTTPDSVVYFSLSSFIRRFEVELQAQDTAGSEIRFEVLCSGDVAERERVLRIPDTDITPSMEPLASSVVFYDFDIGYLLLTSNSSNPYAAVMDFEDPLVATMNSRATGGKAPVSTTPPPPRRTPYQVPAIFYAGNPLESFVEKHVPHRQRHTLAEQVRLSPATLDLVTTAHRVVSAHTNALSRAASDLFIRCERLTQEMEDQLKRISEVAERVNGVTSELDEHGTRQEGSRDGSALDRRLQTAKDRTVNISERYVALRKKLLSLGGRPLSEKEQAWFDEVNQLEASFDDQRPPAEDEADQTLVERLERVKRIAKDLMAAASAVKSRVSAAAGSSPGAGPSSPGPSRTRVPHHLQRARVEDAHRMIERETAVIDDLTARLDRLNGSLR